MIMKNAQLTVAFVLGFSAAAGQIMVVRELTSLFSGFDPIIGLTYAAWLMWTGIGAWAGRRLIGPETSPTAPLALTAGLLLPATLALARAARPLWGIGLGEFPGFLDAVTIVLTLTAPFCLVSGALFSSCWAGVHRTGSRPVSAYAAESLGAAGGGTVLYFVMIPFLSDFRSVCLLLALLAGSGLVAAYGEREGRLVRLLASVALVASMILLACAPRIERVLLKYQWGDDARVSAWTPYHNLVMLKSGGMSTFLADGTWLFSSPDPESGEWNAHLPLLMHPGPESVLLIGGNLFEHASLMLQHPSVKRMDIADPDPDTISFLRAHLPENVTKITDRPEVRIHHRDAADFIAHASEKWDVVCMSLGDPVNAETNRFYTRTFFLNVRRALSPGGLFTFPASAAPDALGPVQERFVRGMAATLKSVFPAVDAVPGTDIRLVAGGKHVLDTNTLTILDRRMHTRGLSAVHVRPDSLADRFSPFRVGSLKQIVNDPGNTEINTDFQPAALFNGILLWTTSLNAGVRNAVTALRESGKHLPWIAVGALLAFMAATGRGHSLKARKQVIGWSVFTTGGTCMVLALALLFGYRVLNGGFYGALALLTGAHMAGLGLGAVSAMNRAPRAGALYAVQGTVFLAAAGLTPLFRHLEATSSRSLILFMFTLLSAGVGTAGGMHFSIGAGLYSQPSPENEDGHEGGVLYGADVLGGMVCSMLFSLVMLPVFGLAHAMLAAAALCAGNLILTMRGLGTGKQP